MTYSTKEDVVQAGGKIIACLYGDVEHEGLDLLRYKKCASKYVTGNMYVQVQALPPTSDAANLHTLRSYYQPKYGSVGGENLDPSEWGVV